MTKNKGRISRRRFLQICGGTLLIAGAEILAESMGIGLLSRRDHSLAHICKERNGIFYEGFPSRVGNARFNFDYLIDKGTEKEVIIFGEVHKSEFREKIVELIDFLVNKHGYDSIGVEGFYGDPSPDLEERVRKDLDSFFEGKNYVDVTYRRFPDNTIEVHKEPLTKGIRESGSYRKYVTQKSVPTYGLEDKETIFEISCLSTIYDAIGYIRQNWKAVGERVHLFGPKGVTNFEDIPHIKQIKEFVEFVKNKFPKVPYPEGSLAHWSCINLENTEFDRYYNHLSFGEIRNHSFKRNIIKYMEQLNSKRGIVLVGYGHAGDVRVGAPYYIRDRPLPYDIEQLLPKILPYTNLVMNASLLPQ